MHHDYTDITSRIEGAPKWWDENGVPRYDEFSPELRSDIYADELAFLEIFCQQCRTPFLVLMSSKAYDDLFRREEYKIGTLTQRVRARTIHYGDPPNYHCCPAGPTMNCIDGRVLEFWRSDGLRWKRDPQLEIVLEGDPRDEGKE